MARAFICGCSGLSLTKEERAFIRESHPFGFILFQRNVETPDQVRALIASFRDCIGAEAAVLVDQEGGRVQRLRSPHWRAYPAAAEFGRLDLPLERKQRLVRLASALIGQDLSRLGIISIARRFSTCRPRAAMASLAIAPIRAIRISSPASAVRPRSVSLMPASCRSSNIFPATAARNATAISICRWWT